MQTWWSRSENFVNWARANTRRGWIAARKLSINDRRPAAEPVVKWCPSLRLVAYRMCFRHVKVVVSWVKECSDIRFDGIVTQLLLFCSIRVARYSQVDTARVLTQFSLLHSIKENMLLWWIIWETHIVYTVLLAQTTHYYCYWHFAEIIIFPYKR